MSQSPKMVLNHSPKTFQLQGNTRGSDLVPFCEDWSKSEKPSEIKLPLHGKIEKRNRHRDRKKYLVKLHGVS